MRKRGKTIKIKSLAKEQNITLENFDSKISLFLNSANRNYNNKDARKFLIEYFTNYETQINKLSETEFSNFTTLSYTCKYLQSNDISIDFHEPTKLWIEKELEKLVEISKNKNTKEFHGNHERNVQKEIWQACRDKIGECDNAFDEILETGKTDFNILEYLKKLEFSLLHLRKIYNYYQEKFQELRKALKAKITKKFYEYNDKGFIGESDEDKDLNESYRFITESKLKKVIDIYDRILLELDNYIKLNGIKKHRKPKVNVKKLVSGVKYLNRSEEFEMTSISPEKIIGSNLVVLFNVKYKKLTVLISDKGMKVKGTSIYDYNPEKSFVKIIKLKNTLHKFVNVDKKVILNEFEKLSNKHTQANGRLGNDTLILNCLK